MLGALCGSVGGSFSAPTFTSPYLTSTPLLPQAGLEASIVPGKGVTAYIPLPFGALSPFPTTSASAPLVFPSSPQAGLEASIIAGKGVSAAREAGQVDVAAAGPGPTQMSGEGWGARGGGEEEGGKGMSEAREPPAICCTVCSEQLLSHTL